MGQKVNFIGSYADTMIHEVATYGGNYGKVSEQHDKLKRTTYVNKKIQKIIASKTNMSLKDIQKDTKKKDTWINSKNALKYGFVDKVKESGKRLPDSRCKVVPTLLVLDYLGIDVDSVLHLINKKELL